jgi:acyl carrier protein
MTDGLTQLVAVDIDWNKFNAQRSLSFESRLFGAVAPAASERRDVEALAAPHEPGADVLVALSEAPARQRHAVLLRFLESRATAVLGIDPSQGIAPGRSLRDLGLDSLQALELRLAIATKLARPLPATLLFDHPTLRALADHLLRELGYANAPVPTGSQPGDEDARAKQIAELEQLTQEEAEALLLAELTGSHSERSDGGR